MLVLLIAVAKSVLHVRTGERCPDSAIPRAWNRHIDKPRQDKAKDGTGEVKNPLCFVIL